MVTKLKMVLVTWTVIVLLSTTGGGSTAEGVGVIMGMGTKEAVPVPIWRLLAPTTLDGVGRGGGGGGRAVGRGRRVVG